jgi:putative modified peptide
MQADVERLLARLLTDRAFRQRFLAEPARIAHEEGLSESEAKAAAEMCVQDLQSAARSYQHKRDLKAQSRARNWLTGWFKAAR